MKKSSKLIFSVASILIIMSLLVFSACAEFGEKRALLNADRCVMAMSHRGGDTFFPANSVEAVGSSFQNEGADMVSVSVRKTADDVLVLCEDTPLYNICETDKGDVSAYKYDEIKGLKRYGYVGIVSDFTISTLEELIKDIAGECVIVIDNAWEFRDDVYELCRDLGDLENVILRTDASSKEIAAWVSSKGEFPMAVIGIYSGNIIFNAISHFDRLSQTNQPAVQYQSKNYFNVMYGNLVTDRFFDGIGARAIAPMYDKDLCGQRSDSPVGWDEMIAKGFTVIETNDVAGLKAHLNQCEAALERLDDLLYTVEEINLEPYSAVSAKNFSVALEKARELAARDAVSLSAAEECMSVLIQAKNNLTFDKGGDLQKGNLNITAGKIIAVVIFGALILAGEIYVHKMHKPKKSRINQ